MTGSGRDVGDPALPLPDWLRTLARPLPHGRVPTPVQITGHLGNSSAKALLAEVLLMTKMKWNSARFGEKLPVTLLFANEVGTILRDLPDDYAPEARYAFYM